MPMNSMWIFLACTGGEHSDKDPSNNQIQDDTHTGDDSGGNQTNPGFQTHGDPPNQLIAAPEFDVLNQNGESRNRENLLGHPTVIWFYPFADTPG